MRETIEVAHKKRCLTNVLRWRAQGVAIIAVGDDPCQKEVASQGSFETGSGRDTIKTIYVLVTL